VAAADDDDFIRQVVFAQPVEARTGQAIGRSFLRRFGLGERF
jgi:hypothetical protein